MTYISNSIDTSTRLAIGQAMCENQGLYGYVTSTANRLGVSRPFLYDACRDLWLRFVAQAENMLRPAKHHAPDLSTADKVLCLYLETHASVEGIRDVLEQMHGIRVGTGRISEMLTAVGKLLPVRDRGGQETLWVLMIDEIFAKKVPILVSIDPCGYIFEVRKVSKCDGATWEETLEALGIDEDSRVIADQGKGLRAAAEKLARYGSDHYHALIPFRKLLKTLDGLASAAIEIEDERRLKYVNADGRSKRGPKEAYERAAARCKRLVDTNADYIYLRFELLAALELVNTDEAGLKSQAQVRGDVEAVLQLMEEIGHEALSKMVQAFRKLLPHLLDYLKDAPAVEKQLRSMFKDKIHADAVIMEYGMRKKQHGMKDYSAQKYFRRQADFWKEALKEALEEDLGQDVWAKVWAEANALLDSLSRGSSMVEAMNSRIRPFLDAAHGQISQARLNLIRFFLNRSTFRRGRRKGHSPLQLLNGDASPGNWMDDIRAVLSGHQATA